MRQCDWYFDIVSPFAYLQWKQRDRYRGALKLRPIPILFAAALNHFGNKGPAEIPPKRIFMYRSIMWRAQRLGVPFKFPDGHPFNPISGLRLILAAGCSEQSIDAVFDAAFQHGRDVADPRVIADLGAKLGMTDVAARIAEPAVKAQLRSNTDAAIARGVFGVPMTFVGNEAFWGEDSTPMILAYVDNPGMFETPEMQRLAQVQTAATR